MLLMPAVSELSVACRSPAMGCRVAACCSMYASLTKDRRKSMAVPSSSSWSTSDGRRAFFCGVASLKIKPQLAQRDGLKASQSLKAMEIGAKQYDKEGTRFWTSKRKKKQTRKNGPPQYTVYA